MSNAPEPCEICGGRGWVVEADGRGGSAYPCSCRQQQKRARQSERTGVPPRYRACTLQSFHTVSDDAAKQEQLVRAKALSQRYLDRFVGEDGKTEEIGLLFTGPPGVGKTHLAVAVLRELVGRYGLHGLFVDFTSLIHQIQSTFDPKSPDSKDAILRPVIESELLVLDELGAQKPTPWVSDLLYLVMNTRYTERRPTIFTTNYRLQAPEPESGSLDRAPLHGGRPSLASRIPASLLSRLFEMATSIEIEAGDFRREVKFAHHRL